MRVVQLTATAGPDGVLRLSIPVGAAAGEFEVAVVVQPKPAPRPPADPSRPPTPEELGWPPGFLEKTFGSITDESFVAPPRLPPRPVPPLDLE